MKKQSKQVQIGLALAVIVVWGLVVFRFRQLSTPGQSDMPALSSLSPVARKLDAAGDSLALNLNYPDPFFGKKTVVTIEKNSQITPAPVTPSTSTNQPVIQYFGYSKDQNNLKRARLLVNGKATTLSEGAQVEGIYLTAIERDSIRVRWQKLQWVVRR